MKNGALQAKEEKEELEYIASSLTGESKLIGRMLTIQENMARRGNERIASELNNLTEIMRKLISTNESMSKRLAKYEARNEKERKEEMGAKMTKTRSHWHSKEDALHTLQNEREALDTLMEGVYKEAPKYVPRICEKLFHKDLVNSISLANEVYRMGRKSWAT